MQKSTKNQKPEINRQRQFIINKILMINIDSLFLSNDDISKEKTNKRIISTTKLFIRTSSQAFDT